MEVEDYFIIALVFAIVAFLGIANPFGILPLSLVDILPTAYFAIAFAIGGLVKGIVTNLTKKK
jgi:hypothetical protein